MNLKGKSKQILAVVLATVLICGAILFFALSNRQGQTTLSVSSDAITYGSLAEMAEVADYIVVGQCAAYDASWNMARDPENPELESASVYIEGRIYRFEAENVLKGEMEDTFSVCYETAVQVSMEDGDSVLAPDGDYVAPDIGETYLLFLTSDGTYYYGIGTPFAVCLTGDGSAELQINTEAQTTEVQTAENAVTVWVESSPAYSGEDTITGMTNDALLTEVQALME